MLSRLFGRSKPAAGVPAQTPTPLPPQPVDLTDANFDAALAAGPAIAVVDFWAEWCAPCRIMSAYVAMLAQQFDGRALVAAVDADENPAVTERFQIQGLPTLLFLRGGAEIDRIVGVVAYEEIKARLAAHLAAQP